MIKRLRVVVVAFNSADHISRCLSSIRASRWTRGPVEVVVVDNASPDDTIRVVEEMDPEVLVRLSAANLGFGGGANLGLRDLAGTDAVALVNPDAFVQPDTFELLAQALDEDPRSGAACPKILFDDGPGGPRINNVGNEISSRWEPRDRGYGEIDAGQYDRDEEVWGWCGGAVLLRSEYLAQVGLFDESLFLYAEDVDLSWRGRKLGWRYRFVPAAIVHHVHRASSGQRRTPLLDYLNRRNRLVVVTRHAPTWGAVVAWVRAVGGIAVAAAGTAVALLWPRRSADLDGLLRRVRAARDAVAVLRGRPVEIPDLDAGVGGAPS